MLNHFHFKSQIEKLAQGFGETVSTDRFEKRKAVYFDMLADKITDLQFTLTVDHLLKNSDKFPTIKTILECSRNFQEPPVVEERAECVVCEGKGTLSAHDQEGYCYIFKCPECKNCKANYPVWNGTEYGSLGFKADLKDKGWNPNDEFQVKGLAMMGPKSIAWQKAPKEMQEKAKLLLNRRDERRNSIKSIDPFGKPDAEQEKLRKQNIQRVEKYETDPLI